MSHTVELWGLSQDMHSINGWQQRRGCCVSYSVATQGTRDPLLNPSKLADFHKSRCFRRHPRPRLYRRDNKLFFTSRAPRFFQRHLPVSDGAGSKRMKSQGRRLGNLRNSGGKWVWTQWLSGQHLCLSLSFTIKFKGQQPTSERNRHYFCPWRKEA